MTWFLAAHAIVLGVLVALALQAFLNHRGIPRLARVPPARLPRRAAVLIPARNEARSIAASVTAWAQQDYADFEVIVLDDDSSDATAAAARAAAAGHAHVRVVRGEGLPPGWRGKPWACHRLREQTTADLLVFADADVSASRDTLARLAGALAALQANLVSALPSHVSAGLAARALLPLQHWAALVFVPAWLRSLRRCPRLTATNGALVALDASVYDAVGGFGAVRATLAEDTALGRRLTRLGRDVRLLDGGGLVTCHAEASFDALWRGNVRNLHAVLFGSVPLATVAVVGLAALFVAPPLALVWSLITAHAPSLATTWLPLAEVALGLLPRALADRRAGYSAWLVLLHPLAVALLAGMIVDSTARAVFGGSVDWRGRRYAVRA